MSDENKDSEENSAEEQNEEAPEAVETETEAPQKREFNGPRLFPAVAIVVTCLVALAVAYVVTNTVMQSAIGFILVPTLATVLLAVWWLRTKGITRMDRVGGLALFGVVLAGIALTQPSNGARLLQLAMPIMAFGSVGLMVLTSGMPWASRRRVLVVAMLGCAVFSLTLRVESIAGNLTPMVTWRWTPTESTWVDHTVSETSGIATLPEEVKAGDWPAFRGPERDGRAPGVVFATDWETNPPKELWRRPVGLGFSSFAVVGDYIFTQEQRNADEVVVCYEANTGKQVWVNSIATRYDDATGSGPRATPTYDKGRLFTLGATGTLQCLDPSTGKAVWKRDLKEDCDATIPVWGFASSPLAVGELIIVFSGGGESGKSTAAYHRETGELTWTSGTGTHGYTSAHLAPFEDIPQVLMVSDVGLQSFAPESGELLWEHSWPINTNPRCVQPLITDRNALMIHSAGGMGTRLLVIGKTDETWNIEEKWTTRRFKPYFNDVVYDAGYCYGFDGARFACYDAAMGKRRWKGTRYGGQVLLLPDMQVLLILSETGRVVLVEANPEEFNEIAELRTISGKTWNHPVIANGKLFVRNSEEAACYALPMQMQVDGLE